MKDLFDRFRCADFNTRVMMVFYSPFGIALVIIRIFITLHAVLVSCILPKSAATSLILKGIFGVIGIQVVVQEDHRKSKKAKIVVSNHVSNLDHMIVDFITPNFTPDFVGLSHVMQWLTGFKDFGRAEGKEVLQRNIKTFAEQSPHPVLLHPENTTTNGKGLLKFSTFPFSMGQVQPIVIQATRWPMKISVSTITSNIYQDFFWCLYVPYTIYKVKYLEEQTCQDGESVEDFTERVRQNMATSLGVPTYNYTDGDKREYVKRIEADEALRKAEENKSRNSANDTQQRASPCLTDPELDHMIQQVRDVLPDTPDSVIRQSLRMTRDIDAAIANIVEGKVPKSTNDKDSNSQSTSQLNIKGKVNLDILPSQQTFGASQFHTSTNNRMMSLEERKKVMLETARQRYKAKHGIP